MLAVLQREPTRVCPLVAAGLMPGRRPSWRCGRPFPIPFRPNATKSNRVVPGSVLALSRCRRSMGASCTCPSINALGRVYSPRQANRSAGIWEKTDESFVVTQRIRTKPRSLSRRVDRLSTAPVAGQVLLKGTGEAGRWHCRAILGALAITNRDGVLGEVDILHPQHHAFV